MRPGCGKSSRPAGDWFVKDVPLRASADGRLCAVRGRARRLTANVKQRGVRKGMSAVTCIVLIGLLCFPVGVLAGGIGSTGKLTLVPVPKGGDPVAAGAGEPRFSGGGRDEGGVPVAAQPLSQELRELAALDGKVGEAYRAARLAADVSAYF